MVAPLAAAVNGASAQSVAPGGAVRTIDVITVEGTQRIEPETVRTYMTLQPGDPFDPAAVNESLKRLFATGFFSTIEILEGTDRRSLIVRVEENPVISLVAFEGNLRINDEDLRPEVQTQPRASIPGQKSKPMFSVFWMFTAAAGGLQRWLSPS